MDAEKKTAAEKKLINEMLTDTYLISYDLKGKSDDDYEALWETLEELKAKRLLHSQWGVRSAKTASELREAIKTSVKPDDLILVSPLSPLNKCSSSNLMNGLDSI